MPLLLPLALVGVMRVAIAKRVAARGRMLGCAAVAPTDPAHPPQCRRWRAPLAIADAAATCTCPYCRTTNLVALQLGAADIERDVRDLDDVLARPRRTEVTSWLLAGATIGCILAIPLLVGR